MGDKQANKLLQPTSKGPSPPRRCRAWVLSQAIKTLKGRSQLQQNHRLREPPVSLRPYGCSVQGGERLQPLPPAHTGPSLPAQPCVSRKEMCLRSFRTPGRPLLAQGGLEELLTPSFSHPTATLCSKAEMLLKQWCQKYPYKPELFNT